MIDIRNYIVIFCQIPVAKATNDAQKLESGFGSSSFELV